MGCSDDDTINNGGEPTAKYDTYLQIAVDSPRPPATKTKPAPGGDGTKPGEGAENEIAKVWVYLVDQTSGEIVSADEPGINKERVTDPFSVPEGTYNLFVVANPTVGMTKKAIGASIEDVITNVTEAQAKGGYSEGYFL